MYVQKRVLCENRLRRVHRPFGWVDVRLLREDWLKECSTTAWALYLFWVTVADAQGLSYYADQRVAKQVRISGEAVIRGRAELLRAGLLAYDPPLVQVLALDKPQEGRRSLQGEARRTPREEAVLLGDLLRPWIPGGAS